MSNDTNKNVVLLIGLGTTGARIATNVQRQLHGKTSVFLDVFDTDPSTQQDVTNSGGYFHRIQAQDSRDISTLAPRHAVPAELRLLTERCETIMTDRSLETGARANRDYGRLLWLVNLPWVLGELNVSFKRVSRELSTANDRIFPVLIASAGGGTGGAGIEPMAQLLADPTDTVFGEYLTSVGRSSVLLPQIALLIPLVHANANARNRLVADQILANAANTLAEVDDLYKDGLIQPTYLSDAQSNSGIKAQTVDDATELLAAELVPMLSGRTSEAWMAHSVDFQSMLVSRRGITVDESVWSPQGRDVMEEPKQ